MFWSEIGFFFEFSGENGVLFKKFNDKEQFIIANIDFARLRFFELSGQLIIEGWRKLFILF